MNLSDILRELKSEPPSPPCERCGVSGCVCEYCDDCERDVNPYTHFREWNPDSGAHVSDIALRAWVDGKAGPWDVPRD